MATYFQSSSTCGWAKGQMHEWTQSQNKAPGDRNRLSQNLKKVGGRCWGSQWKDSATRTKEGKKRVKCFESANSKQIQKLTMIITFRVQRPTKRQRSDKADWAPGFAYQKLFPSPLRFPSAYLEASEEGGRAPISNYRSQTCTVINLQSRSAAIHPQQTSPRKPLPLWFWHK